MVDLVWPHIKFINIWPLEGGIGVFICILWRFSRFLTTHLAKRPTCNKFLHSVPKILFASYSTGLKLSIEPGAWIFPLLKKNSSGATIPLWTDSVVRGSPLPLLKFWPNRRSVDLLILGWGHLPSEAKASEPFNISFRTEFSRSENPKINNFSSGSDHFRWWRHRHW